MEFFTYGAVAVFFGGLGYFFGRLSEKDNKASVRNLANELESEFEYFRNEFHERFDEVVDKFPKPKVKAPAKQVN